MFIAALRKWLLRWEGYTAYWYLSDHPTIGIGLDYPTPSRVMSLGEGALLAWNTISQAEPGHLAEWYAIKSAWRANEALLEQEFERRLLGFYAHLKSIFSDDYDDWPEGCRIGSFDLAYNEGLPPSEWPRFIAACRARDWATAAVQCQITKGNPPKDREAARKALFADCVPDPTK